MEHILPRSVLNWTREPIPGFLPSAGGLIALADLSTVSQRTAIAGGSSWLDALLLAPGLHYQQAADSLSDGSPSFFSAAEFLPSKTTLYSITNTATIRYLQRVALTGQDVVINVGPELPKRLGHGLGRRRRQHLGPGSHASHDLHSQVGWFSHVLYLLSPVLTAVSFILMALLADWWGVGLLSALMFARILNIWVIKQRSQPQPPPSTPTSSSPSISSSISTTYPSTHKPHAPDDINNDDFLTEYIVDIGPSGRTVHLRGLSSDLQALTTSSWLATKTHAQGYLEAAAKLTVYLVAALSGQLSQLGALIFMTLLLITAGLLGLSNAHAKHMQMHGRIAVPEPAGPKSPLFSSFASNSPAGSQQRRQEPARYRGALSQRQQADRSDGGMSGQFPWWNSVSDTDVGPSWPPSTMTRRSSSGLTHDMEDLAEKGQSKPPARRKMAVK
ncbi:hypothetical protein Micbo1qcDRAFT_193179 [Microdochium bolleyi]|uniref:Uncharacterized protein n=1 Tax=Microdochium bolleyi TaxID=196109 RepID=A0A136J9J0_9PEZI|nr:hypothetical protein Micbo1qcDRAFT_193179 [Microdochium bolleyi]